MEETAVRIILPETGFVRLNNIIGDTKTSPPIPAIIPVSKSTWWAGVKTGRFPKPIKIAPRITVWRVDRRRYRARSVHRDDYGPCGCGYNRLRRAHRKSDADRVRALRDQRY